MLATGHYARLLHSQAGNAVQLLRGVDWEKDQSYFLASVVSSELVCIEILAHSLTSAKTLAAYFTIVVQCAMCNVEYDFSFFFCSVGRTCSEKSNFPVGSFSQIRSAKTSSFGGVDYCK
jgi:hypothetical protein